MNIQEVVIPDKDSVELQSGELDTKSLSSDELLIATDCTFISAGTELSIYTGIDPNVRTPGAWCCYPYHAGYANVGRIEQMGSDIAGFAIGDRVFTYGPHASHYILKVPQTPTNVGKPLVAPVPASVSSAEAAASRMAQVAMTALDVASIAHHRYVAVFGLGMVGNLAAQMFQAAGATVIGVDPSPKRRKLALDCGIPHTVGGEENEIKTQIEAITNGQMAQVSIDAVGHSAVCLQCIEVTANFGEVIILGSPRQPVQGNLTEVFSASHYRWITIKGALEWRIPTYHQLPSEHSQIKKFEAIMAWLADGRLKLAPLITHVLPPSEIKDAYEGLLHKKDEYLGVVLQW